LHYRLGWVASPGALPRERFSSMTPQQTLALPWHRKVPPLSNDL
jgi:hypothetical protein